jgi:TonB family protein
MNATRRRLLAVLFGCGLLAATLLLIFLDGLMSVEPPARVTLREVALYDPPPPPPPPVPRQDQTREATPELSSARRQIPIELTTMDLGIELDAGTLSGIGVGEDWGGAIDVEVGSVEFSDLDDTPVVLSSPLIRYPQELLDQGIKSFVVRLHILIDEQGRAYLISVIESDYPAYDTELRDYVSDVRFSPPTFLGVPVRTEFLWPVEFLAP